MARKKAKKTKSNKSLLELVTEMHDTENERDVFKRLHRSRNPLVKRAFRIHRHLQALEAEIAKNAGHGCVSLTKDKSSDKIVLIIRNDEMHCCRFAYLSKGELHILESNDEVGKELRSCPAWEDVA
jgi:hypothetical protein